MVETEDVAMFSNHLTSEAVCSPKRTDYVDSTTRCVTSGRKATTTQSNWWRPYATLNIMLCKPSTQAAVSRLECHVIGCQSDKKDSRPSLGMLFHWSDIRMPEDGRNEGHPKEGRGTEGGGGKRELHFTPLLKIAAR
jgi:hypothetical protein